MVPPASGDRPQVALLALAAGLVPALVAVVAVGLANDGFFGGFALGVGLVLAVMIVVLARKGLRARRR